MFGLLGPNGAGKSTFINILAGLVNKTAGKVHIWGMDIDVQPRTARGAIGVVHQEIVSDVFFTPREALEVQAGFYGVKKKDRKTDEILASLGLTDKADAYVRQLSGGMKRRLMVAKAMVHSPPILILDEPTAGVDVELRRQLWGAGAGAECAGRHHRAHHPLPGGGPGALRHHRHREPGRRGGLRTHAPAAPPPGHPGGGDRPCSLAGRRARAGRLRRQATFGRSAGGDPTRASSPAWRRCWPRSAPPACRSAT